MLAIFEETKNGSFENLGPLLAHANGVEENVSGGGQITVCSVKLNPQSRFSKYNRTS
jgi:hypothetical protein